MDVRVDYKESWAPKNWCFWTVVLEKTLESPMDCKEIQPVHPKGNHSWIFIGRTDVEAETPKFWPPDAKSWLICKDPDAGKDWGQEEKGKTKDEWDGWIASLTQWTRVWVDSGSWWWTRKPGMLQFMGSQRVGHDWATELNWSVRINNPFNHLWDEQLEGLYWLCYRWIRDSFMSLIKAIQRMGGSLQWVLCKDTKERLWVISWLSLFNLVAFQSDHSFQEEVVKSEVSTIYFKSQ